jgi:hypothetical protein
MKIENIDEVLHLTKEFRNLQELNQRLHENGTITVHVNGFDIEISNELRKRVRNALIEEVKTKRDEIRKQLETL